MKIVYILRGFAGAGKSILAQAIVSGTEGIICSSDDFFTEDDEYTYRRSVYTQAHMACKAKFKKATEKGISPIVVDNTNARWKSFAYYRTWANRNGYTISVVGVNIPDDEVQIEELRKKAFSGVPKEKFDEWFDRWEDGPTHAYERKLERAHNV